MKFQFQPFINVMLAITCAVTLVACGGNNTHSENPSRNDNDDSACITVYEPVCALSEENGKYRYQTFGNRCVANLENAEVSFEAECGALEDEGSEASQPVIVHESVDQLPENSSGVTVLESEISQDVAQLTVEHSGGCGEHRFDLHVAPPFMESWPLQINARLTHETDDTCEALITTDVSIDLLPLKNLYHMNYDSESGEIQIPHVGLYQF